MILKLTNHTDQLCIILTDDDTCTKKLSDKFHACIIIYINTTTKQVKYIKHRYRSIGSVNLPTVIHDLYTHGFNSDVFENLTGHAELQDLY